MLRPLDENRSYQNSRFPCESTSILETDPRKWWMANVKVFLIEEIGSVYTCSLLARPEHARQIDFTVALPLKPAGKERECTALAITISRHRRRIRMALTPGRGSSKSPVLHVRSHSFRGFSMLEE